MFVSVEYITADRLEISWETKGEYYFDSQESICYGTNNCSGFQQMNSDTW